ncbi:MAG: hypothetical protein ABJA89_16565 [Lapillicoccus sp.]
MWDDRPVPAVDELVARCAGDDVAHPSRSPRAPTVPGKVTPMSKRSRKRRTRKNKSANHGRKPNA